MNLQTMENRASTQILMKRAVMINNNIIMTEEDIFIIKTALRYFVDNINAQLSDEMCATTLELFKIAANTAYDKLTTLPSNTNGLDNSVETNEHATDGE